MLIMNYMSCQYDEVKKGSHLLRDESKEKFQDEMALNAELNYSTELKLDFYFLFLNA